MPLVFNSTLHGASKNPDDVMVSRIGLPKPRPLVHMPMARRTATSANTFFFGSPPIEQTLRHRQALAASASAPALGSPQRRRDVLLPRIGTAIASGRVDESMGRSGPAWVNPQFGSIQDFSRWSAISTDGTLKGNIGGATLLTRPKPGLYANDNNWCGVLNGDYKVPIPFEKFRGDSNITDGDAFLRWHRGREADGQAEKSRNRCPEPPTELLPWGTERDVALLQLRNVQEGSGKALYLMSRADLFDHLDFKAPLRGVEAILHALAFRCDTVEHAAEMLDCNGSGKISLMEFVGSMGVLSMDFETLVGVDDASVFRGLDQDCDGLVSVDHFVNLWYFVKPNKNRPPSSSAETEQEEQNTPSLAEIQLQSPQEDPPDVAKAKVKWSRIARWMSAASLRSIAFRTERLLKGWKVDPSIEAQSSPKESPPKEGIADENVNADPEEDEAIEAQSSPKESSPKEEIADENVNADPQESEAIAEGEVGTPVCQPPSTPQSPSSRSVSSHSPKTSKKGSLQSSNTINIIEASERLRTPTAAPSEMALEGLAVMREHEGPLQVLFNAAASIKLPDGTPEMSRKDLHLFFQDLQLADWERHARLTPELLDNLYDEALDLQCKFTRIGNGLTFWSMKVVLNNIIGSLGLGWRRLIEMSLHPDVLAEATQCTEKS